MISPGRNAPPGMGRAVNRVFYRYPVVFPLAIFLAGLLITMQSFSPMGLILLVLGSIALPFGIFMSIRRRRNAQVLACPACGTESRQARRPFTIERPGYVDYDIATCSKCGEQFTIGRYTRYL